jgi:hypothetical protein
VGTELAMRARCRDGSRPRGTVVPGPPGRRCHFPTPGGTRRVPKGAKCAARDPGRAARGDARRNLSSLSGLIWRPSAIVADARVPGASRQASVREICGARSTRRVPKRNESFGDDVRVSAHRQTVTSRCLIRERRVASESIDRRVKKDRVCEKMRRYYSYSQVSRGRFIRRVAVAVSLGDERLAVPASLRTSRPGPRSDGTVSLKVSPPRETFNPVTSRLTHATQVRGLRKASMASASRLPSAGCMSYCHLAVRGRDMRMDSMRPPVLNPKVVPRSYTRLNST